MPGPIGRKVGGLAVVAIAVSIASGCGEEDPEQGSVAATNTTTTATASGEQTITTGSPPPEPSGPKPPPAHCPPELENCATASGTIIYIERVDPDGDGDAHFVLSSEEGITATGLSVIDVPADLRPHPLPEFGQQISAAGPVYTGSYGQRQIEAIELNVAG